MLCFGERGHGKASIYLPFLRQWLALKHGLCELCQRSTEEGQLADKARVILLRQLLAGGQLWTGHRWVSEMLVVMLQAAEKSQLADKTKADTARQLLAVVDSFEMAKGQLKPESEGEQKIDGAYQVRRTSLRRPGFQRYALATCSPISAIHARQGKHRSQCSDRAQSAPVDHLS